MIFSLNCITPALKKVFQKGRPSSQKASRLFPGPSGPVLRQCRSPTPVRSTRRKKCFKRALPFLRRRAVTPAPEPCAALHHGGANRPSTSSSCVPLVSGKYAPITRRVTQFRPANLGQRRGNAALEGPWKCSGVCKCCLRALCRHAI